MNRIFRIAYMAIAAVFFSFGCQNTQAWVEDPQGFCDSFEFESTTEGTIEEGLFTIGGFKPLLLNLQVDTAKYGSMSFVEVRIKTLGAQPGAPIDYTDAANGHIYVCAGDCIYVDDSFYSSQITIKTDEDGIGYYTITAGKNAAGFILEDWGSATCVRSIAPYVGEEEL